MVLQSQSRRHLASPIQGDLWWDSIGGNLYIYYIDVDSNQWVIASPNVGGGGEGNIFTGSSTPQSY